ncbi:DUF1007 family protein [Devosia sp.]|uniref:HoxN/HupN/NixA family nickel/cobalt transporter n=1 Tax=Devosia sp. TaxID=1871048 RepID=UPI0032649FAE
MLHKIATLALWLVGFTVAAILPAAAHPHIFIDAKLAVVFDQTGAVIALRHSWTFDEAFSAWAIQGLDTNKDGTVSDAEMQDLADDNVKGLSEYGFYTFAGKNGTEVKFKPTGEQKFHFENGRNTLTYTIDTDTPYHIKGRFELGISDPEYYVAITFANKSDITLENAPAGCSVELDPPKDLDPALADKLYALGPEVLVLPPDLAAAMRGTQGLVAINCPTGVAAAPPATALDAVNAVGVFKAAPFGGPPSEPGLPLPHNGFFKAIQDMQRDFYAAMTSALGKLRTDYTAFWLLGGLSFLYGVIHAAGPGHGKVVISSYMLANETQVKRGITLSFISAMMQSLVAVAFVLIAAGILGMTSMAMSDAASWISIASYAMVCLLGLWLIARKIFGWGHGHAHDAPPSDEMRQLARSHLHGHEEHDHHGHDHGHHHDHAGHNHATHDHSGHKHAVHDHHEHLHIVPADKTTGSLREQLGVVFAVGLRPCSGALVVLVFALSQGVLAAGIAAVFLMGLGTAITVGILATLAVTAKGLARRIGGADNKLTAGVVWWAELLGAVLVLAFGVVLLIASF